MKEGGGRRVLLSLSNFALNHNLTNKYLTYEKDGKIQSENY